MESVNQDMEDESFRIENRPNSSSLSKIANARRNATYKEQNESLKLLFQSYNLAPAPLINGPKFDTLLRYSLVSVTNEGACWIPDINYNGYLSPEVLSIAIHLQTAPGATPNKADSFKDTCPLDQFGASEYA